MSAHPSCLGPVPAPLPPLPWGINDLGLLVGGIASGRLRGSAKAACPCPGPCSSLSGCLLGGLVRLPGEGGHRVPPGSYSVTFLLRGLAGRSPQGLPSFLVAAD